MKKPLFLNLFLWTIPFLATAEESVTQQPGSRPVVPAEQREAAQIKTVETKLKTIVIPSVNFENTTVGEAIDFLRIRVKELDTSETDPAKKGLSFLVMNGQEQDQKKLPSNRVIHELRLKDIPAEALLKYICEMTSLRYKIEPHAVVIRP